MTRILPWWVRWVALGLLVVAVATFFYVRGADAKDADWSLRDNQRVAREAVRPLTLVSSAGDRKRRWPAPSPRSINNVMRK